MNQGPFSLLPYGLPNLFGLTGQALPKSYDDVVRLQLGALEFLASANCREVIIATNATPSGPGVSSFAGLIVPETEAWLVLGCAVGWTTTGAELLRARALVLRDSTASPNQCPIKMLGEGTSSLTGVAKAATVQIVNESPFLMYPNDNIAVNVIDYIGGASIAVSARACVYRFTV